MLTLATEFTFPVSAFVPIAVGFFGLGTGYLIYGPEELFKLPARSRPVDLTTGIWGIWMPGFMQFLTGVYLWVGLAWFHSFREKPLYMAALAFTAYGVHWWAIGMARAPRRRPAAQRVHGGRVQPLTIARYRSWCCVSGRIIQRREVRDLFLSAAH